MKYRPEIDGLRAVAVVPVVLFHAGLPGFGGGFVGVDIFFVISGYLITLIIYKEMQAGQFSLWYFYARRVRRIVPVLVSVLLATVLAGYMILVPSRFEELLQATAATALFASNIYLWRTTDYFSTAAELNPLLHTWSLGIEEQFYIVFPLLMMLVFARGDAVLKRVLLSLIGLSFILSIALVVVNRLPEANFYLLPTRAWEIAVGSLLAISNPATPGTRRSSYLAFLGLAMIFASFIGIDASMPFPGYVALLPVMGTAILIRYASPYNIVGRFLSIQPLVWIGLLSYSIYLWHQPVLAYARYTSSADVVGVHVLLPLALVMVLSYISWRWIERPFRYGIPRLSSRKVVLSGAAALALPASFIIFMSNDFAYQLRYPEPVRNVFSFLDYRQTDDYERQFLNGCFVSGRGTHGPFPLESCIVIDENVQNVLLIGDSHAAMFALALREQFPGVNFIQATASGCMPALGTGGREICSTMRDSVLESLLGDTRVNAVLFAGRWQSHMLNALVDTVSQANNLGHAVTVFGPAPEYETDFPFILGQAMSFEDQDRTMSYFSNDRLEIEKALRFSLDSMAVQYVSLIDLICDKGPCQAFTSAGEPMQFDYGHLTLTGARDVVSSARANGLVFE